MLYNLLSQVHNKLIIAFKYVSLPSRFEEVQLLGNAVLEDEPGAQDVKDKMKRLADDQKTIDELYKKRLKDLQDAYDLAVCFMCL